MAIDSRERRQSAYGAFHVRGIPPVTPSAANDQEWRQEAFWGYSGILAAEAIALPECTLGVLSIVRLNGTGIQSEITNYGIGLLSKIEPSEGLLGIVRSNGIGVLSTITSDGQGVESTLCR